MQKLSALQVTIVVLLLCLTNAATAAELRLVISSGRAPYVYAETKSGVEYEIIETVVKKMGYELKPIFVPSARLPLMLKEKDVDGVVNSTRATGDGLFYSDPHIEYYNCYITLAERNLDLKKLDDIKGLSLAGFADARIYLGPEFKAATTKAKKYIEYGQQLSQIKLLLGKRVDVVIADRYIFNYNLEKAIRQGSPSLPVKYHHVFPPHVHGYGILFKDKTVRDNFNIALGQIKKDGTYKNLLKKYHIETH